jgi:hypothetical protein
LIETFSHRRERLSKMSTEKEKKIGRNKKKVINQFFWRCVTTRSSKCVVFYVSVSVSEFLPGVRKSPLVVPQRKRGKWMKIARYEQL